MYCELIIKETFIDRTTEEQLSASPASDACSTPPTEFGGQPTAFPAPDTCCTPKELGGQRSTSPASGTRLLLLSVGMRGQPLASPAFDTCYTLPRELEEQQPSGSSASV
ncbi:hypothetical protein J6590_029510 [Homalodisca vitripennis]|nr:hypothetical protein J6590_029510 [Homalodisca vitripennis]